MYILHIYVYMYAIQYYTLYEIKVNQAVSGECVLI